MSGVFRPRMDVLPLAQRKLWPQLRNAADLGFALYGGTAVALRLGHRSSVDFDFFSDRPLDREAIKSALPFLARSTTIQDQNDAWGVLAPGDESANEHVKVSFFGTIGFGRVGHPEFTDDGVVEVASFDDLMATKVKTILQRAEAKDYHDLAAMIKAGASLARGLSSARLFFGQNFQPSESLKALTFFKDGDLKTLSAAERKILVDAVRNVGDLPEIALLSTRLSAGR